MSVELLPCPFCGGEAAFKSHPGSYGYTSPSTWIACTNPKCTVRPKGRVADTTDWKQGIGAFNVDPTPELTAEWNARVEK